MDCHPAMGQSPGLTKMADLIFSGYRKDTSDLRKRDRLDYWCDIICDEFVQLDCNNVVPGDFIGELHGGVGISDLRFSKVIADPQACCAVQAPDSQVHRSGFPHQLSDRESGPDPPERPRSPADAQQLCDVRQHPALLPDYQVTIPPIRPADAQGGSIPAPG